MECPDGNCVISTRKANQIIRSKFDGKEARRPTFYIKYGPPASGKGGIMENVLIKDQINDKSLVTVEVDSIIESNPGYITKRTELIQKKDEKGKSELYWKYRSEADIISDQILDKALLGNYDIAWETTGRTIAWTVREIKRIRKKGYNVTLVYPLVPAETLVSRSKEREKKTGQTPAPEKQIREGVVAAIDNLEKLIDVLDKIYLYDNSGEKGDENIVIEIENVWDGKKEDAKGLTRNVNCDCNKLNTEMSVRFAAEIMNVLNKLCHTCEINQN